MYFKDQLSQSIELGIFMTRVKERTSSLTGARSSHRIIVLVHDRVDFLDLAIPLEVFHIANFVVNEVYPERKSAYNVKIIGNTKDELVVSGCGPRILVDQPSAEFRGKVDTLIVPGGEFVDIKFDKDTIENLVNIAARSSRVASICTGAFLLAEAGLLDGKSGVTHWRACEELRKRYPQITVDDDAIFVEDGNVFSSAGSTAGIDLMLHLLQIDYGHEVATRVARNLVVFLRRRGGQSQFSEVLKMQSDETSQLAELIPWIVNNIEKDLRVDILAKRCNMSSRSFVRQFPKVTGQTPAKFVEAMRVEATKRKLEHSTNMSFDEIADAVGFGSAESMRRCFQRATGVTPSYYREAFKAAK